ncbi:DUF4910 domain-containing protein [Peribacillus sp. SCS-37]|uniref:DUF4910 domain-containing protein n=1 Tax=Paraperibacillus esterisolvens TaxID=3115296 RepID=UPI0039067BB4
MFDKWRRAIKEEFSKRQAYRYADRISQYHRIQASPGYRAAAGEVIQLLKRDGVEAELISYPAEFGGRLLSHRTFKEWHCRSAELWVETPVRERIARFEEEEISLVQRSISTPPEGIRAELAVVENGNEEAGYEGLDIKGKLVLVQGAPALVHALAVEKYGAAGLIFENLNDYPPLRTRMDMPDTRQYTSFWWDSEEQPKTFGFVVSPRIANKLKELAGKQKVILTARVDAKLYDGHYENIEYFIPGKKEKEILLVSHLCHPYPGGQDNSSGPGTLMEVMRTLTKLIKTGILPEPEFGIRFLMMPEMYGTCAYLDQHPERIPHTIAALNLDMVGADQAKGGGPLCVEQPPMAVPTFTDRYLYYIIHELSTNAANFTGTSQYSTIHHLRTRHSGGSDHYILSDSSIGIPCPMLIQWPDRHYHTTSDTTANLDGAMMGLVGQAAALYCYGLANGSEEDWISYLFHHSSTISSELSSAKEWIMRQSFSAAEAKKAVDHFCLYEKQALEELGRYAALRGFAKALDLADWAMDMHKKQAELCSEMADRELMLHGRQELVQDESPPAWQEAVYSRCIRGPLRLFDELESLSLEEKLKWYCEYESTVPVGYSDFIFNWMDGRRTAGEIVALVQLETGQHHPIYAEKLLELCLDLGITKKAGVAESSQAKMHS